MLGYCSVNICNHDNSTRNFFKSQMRNSIDDHVTGGLAWQAAPCNREKKHPESQNITPNIPLTVHVSCHSIPFPMDIYNLLHIIDPSAPTTPFLPPLRLQGQLPGQVRRGQKCNKHWRKWPNHLASGMIMPMDAIICHHMPLDANLATFLGGPLMWSYNQGTDWACFAEGVANRRFDL